MSAPGRRAKAEGARLSPSVRVAEGLDGPAVIRAVLGGAGHLIQAGSPAELEASLELARGLSRDPDRFRSDPLGAFGQSFEVEGHPGRRAAIGALDSSVDGQPSLSTLKGSVLCVADELLTNALASSGGRGPSVATFFWKLEPRAVALACTDPNGRLDPRAWLERILRSYETGVAAAINEGHGGAGIGGRIVFERSSEVAVVVRPGSFTTVLCRVRAPSGSEGATGKSLHLVVAGEERR